MELALDLGLFGWIVVIVAALVFGVLAQYVGETRTGYEWLPDGLAFGVGAIAASEFVIGWQAFEPVYDGLALVPALIGGLVVGVIVEVATRYITGGSYSHVPA